MLNEPETGVAERAPFLEEGNPPAGIRIVKRFAAIGTGSG
jgi:hypothetical protein